MRPSLASIRVLLAGVSIATAAFVGCAQGATLGTGPGGDGGDGGDGGGDTGGHQGGGTNGTGGAGTTSVTTTTTGTTTPTTTTTTTSTTTTTTSTTTSTTTTTGGGGACDNSGLCDTCFACSTDVGGQCELEYLICVLDTECLDFAGCLDLCAMGDDVCVNACVTSYPFGAQEYSDMAYCVVCGACYGDCDGANSGC